MSVRLLICTCILYWEKLQPIQTASTGSTTCCEIELLRLLPCMSVSNIRLSDFVDVEAIPLHMPLTLVTIPEPPDIPIFPHRKVLDVASPPELTRIPALGPPTGWTPTWRFAQTKEIASSLYRTPLQASLLACRSRFPREPWRRPRRLSPWWAGAPPEWL